MTAKRLNPTWTDLITELASGQSATANVDGMSELRFTAFIDNYANLRTEVVNVGHFYHVARTIWVWYGSDVKCCAQCTRSGNVLTVKAVDSSSRGLKMYVEGR